MYENHFSIKLISIEKLYIMTTMSKIEEVKYNGIWYIKTSDFQEQQTKWKETYIKMQDERDDKWRREWDEKMEECTLNYEEQRSQWKLGYAKLKSIITDYENKITKYLEKNDIQQATIISLKTEVDVLEQIIEEELYTPVIECELETKKCNGLKCKGQFQPLELFMKKGKTLKNCKICRDHKCELDKKSRKKPRYTDMYELD